MLKKEPHKNNKEIPLDASLGMAIMDALPVLCFCLTLLFIGTMFQSGLFIVGGILCILAGYGKALWKFLVAV
ncbi:MAG: hypothetical protein LUF92_01005, partial [Clostridiales bacterium]|nr:hypothetical protein [Clostridiales bacterium]